MTANEAKIIPNWDFNFRECIDLFRKAAKESTAEVTKSKAAARRALIKDGIIT